MPLLQWLAATPEVGRVVGVFTQPDRPVGRGQVVQPNDIKVWAAAAGLPVYQPEKLTEDVRAQLAALQPDLGLVMAYGHILRDDFIATPRLGTLNLHTSLLPKYRGASPIQTAVASGDRETGVTLMRIVRRLDAGPIADVERVPILPLDTAAAIDAKLAQACVPLLARALPKFAVGALGMTPQDDAAATYCRKLEKADGVLDFSAPAATLAARINGLFPWPSCNVEIAGQPVKLGLADVAENASAGSGEPASSAASAETAAAPSVVAASAAGAGRVLGTDASGLLVSTGNGVLRLRRLQRPGGKMLAAADFLRGFPVAPGTELVSRPMPVLVSTR